MQVSKHITKSIRSLDNADETYNIEVEYDYCLEKSLICVYLEIKNLLDNKKRKFCYKIETLISASHLHKNNQKKIHTDKTKTCSLKYLKDK